MQLRYSDGTVTSVGVHHRVFLALIPADCQGPSQLTARNAAGGAIASTHNLQIGSGC